MYSGASFPSKIWLDERAVREVEAVTYISYLDSGLRDRADLSLVIDMRSRWTTLTHFLFSGYYSHPTRNFTIPILPKQDVCGSLQLKLIIATSFYRSFRSCCSHVLATTRKRFSPSLDFFSQVEWLLDPLGCSHQFSDRSSTQHICSYSWFGFDARRCQMNALSVSCSSLISL